MINISTEELEKLDKLDKVGFGSFSRVYRKDDKVYKIYKEEVKKDKHSMMENPMLKHRNRTINKCKTLIILNRFIKNTDLVEDLAYVDGVFYGVVMPYYDGKTFYELLDSPFEKRIDYSSELVENAKELTNYYIYVKDYSLKNVMVVDDKVKIIDLDDITTKIWYFKNYFLEKRCIGALDETIRAFLHENYYGCHDKELMDLIDFESYAYSYNYSDINDYLANKKIKKNLLFLDETYDSCVDKVYSNHIIYTYDKHDVEYIAHCISLLKDKGVVVNDVVKKSNIDNYMNNFSTNSCLYAQGSKILKLK